MHISSVLCSFLSKFLLFVFPACTACCEAAREDRGRVKTTQLPPLLASLLPAARKTRDPQCAPRWPPRHATTPWACDHPCNLHCAALAALQFFCRCPSIP